MSNELVDSKKKSASEAFVNSFGGYPIGYGDTQSITDMLKLFFEEVSWFDSIPWKMRRCTQ